MKTAEQIIEDVKFGNTIENYNLLEMHLYICIEQIIQSFLNNCISKNEANKRKMLAVKKYIELQKQYNFEKSMFKEYIDNIKKTEFLRITLRKRMNDNEPVTEEKMAELLNICLELISLYSKEEF